MADFLTYSFNDNESFINTFDEAPLWSAAFGLLMLKHLEVKPDLRIIDIGSGAGFPLLELAGRFGQSCQLYGIDPWHNANKRARQKLVDYAYSNVEIIEASAASIPFDIASIDLIVSNLGINNFDQPGEVFKECQRVLKQGGKLVITSNLEGHWKEFYQIFYATLNKLGKPEFIDNLKKEEKHRGTLQSISNLYQDNGFKVTKVVEDQFEMKFSDGSAFLNHHFVKLGWITSWFDLFPKEGLDKIFRTLEQDLNLFSRQNKGLVLTVPMACFEGERL